MPDVKLNLRVRNESRYLLAIAKELSKTVCLHNKHPVEIGLWLDKANLETTIKCNVSSMVGIQKLHNQVEVGRWSVRFLNL